MEYMKALTRFTKGQASFEEMDGALSERLAQLRETPEVSEEQRLLSSLELALEESREGSLTPGEAVARGASILEALTKLNKSLSPRSTRLPA